MLHSQSTTRRSRRCRRLTSGALSALVVLMPLGAPSAHADPAHADPAHAEAVRGKPVDAARIDYAERPVREFLKRHFAGSRAFNGRGLDGKERLLTRRFRNTLYKFFGSEPATSGAAPMVNDPFTGSQGASTYTLGKPKVRGEKAWVPVTFSDGTNSWTITYLLRNDQERGDDDWRIDDIQDVRGMLLSKVLKR